MIFLGFVGMIDLFKRGVKLVISKVRKVGVKIVMIIGDYKFIVFVIVREFGIVESFEEVVIGEEFEKDEKFIEKNIDNILVFVRVDLFCKLKIVRFLKRKENIVVMIGDGVNDVLVVKEVDIGIVMGISGIDVIKEAVLMVLFDDNYVMIVYVIEEGRIIYDNIKKFVKYFFVCNIGEVLIMFFILILNLLIVFLFM